MFYYFKNFLKATFFIFSVAANSSPPSSVRLVPHWFSNTKSVKEWRSKEDHHLLLSPNEIEKMNSKNKKNFLTNQRDIKRIIKIIKNDIKQIESKKKELFLSDGHSLSSYFLEKNILNMNLEGQKGFVKFGIIVKYADQYTLPTQQPFYDETSIALLKQFSKKQLHMFGLNQNQENGLDVGTPVQIFLESKDKKWVYGGTEQGLAWFKKECIALCTAAVFEEWKKEPEFIVLTTPRASCYKDKGLKYIIKEAPVSLGTRLPLNKAFSSPDKIAAYIPQRTRTGVSKKTVYFKTKEVHKGFLPYTRENLLTLCCVTLGQRYGWGCVNGDPDCSALLQRIYATMGIWLPRNSAAQAKAGKIIDTSSLSLEEKTALLKKMKPGAILYFPGHVGLYMGFKKEKDGKEVPYLFHTFWALSLYDNPLDETKFSLNIISKTVISPLCGSKSGENGPKKSLLHRLKSIHCLFGMD